MKKKERIGILNVWLLLLRGKNLKNRYFKLTNEPLFTFKESLRLLRVCETVQEWMESITSLSITSQVAKDQKLICFLLFPTFLLIFYLKGAYPECKNSIFRMLAPRVRTRILREGERAQDKWSKSIKTWTFLMKNEALPPNTDTFKKKKHWCTSLVNLL